MQRFIYVQERNRRSEPKVVSVRDDGGFDVSDSRSPSPTALLIGRFQETLCFEETARFAFLIWDSTTKTVVQEIGYDGFRYENTVSGFAKTVQGDLRIVMLARTGPSFSTRIYRGENDNRARAREPEEAVHDGWGAWEKSGQNTAFQPSPQQLARFSVSEDERGCIYWGGKDGKRCRILRFSVATEAFTCLLPPRNDLLQEVRIGHGLDGELALTQVEKIRFSHVLHIWCRRGADWVDITRVILDASQHSVCFVPLCFYHGRQDGQLSLLLLKDGLTIIRFRPLNLVSHTEELFSAPSCIRASSLPQQRYNVKFTRDRTEEEEEEARAAKRRNMKNVDFFEHILA